MDKNSGIYIAYSGLWCALISEKGCSVTPFDRIKPHILHFNLQLVLGSNRSNLSESYNMKRLS